MIDPDEDWADTPERLTETEALALARPDYWFVLTGGKTREAYLMDGLAGHRAIRHRAGRE